MTRHAVRGATTLIAAISVRADLAPASSIVHAAFNVSSRACSISIRDKAIASWIVPWSDNGPPKAIRLLARSTIIESARSAWPIDLMQ